MLRFVVITVILSISAYSVLTQSDFILFADATTNINQTDSDPLPSWKGGDTKQRIVEFVHNITDGNIPRYYIPPEDRIAVFDNDGTLWSEKPLYFQLYFSLDRVEDLVTTKTELKNVSPFKEILQNNQTALQNMTEKDVMNLVLMTHSNITKNEFHSIVQQWADTAKHPQTQRKFVDMVYQPMLELLDYLKANQFKNFIVSGGGIDFIREALS